MSLPLTCTEYDSLDNIIHRYSIAVFILYPHFLLYPEENEITNTLLVNSSIIIHCIPMNTINTYF